MKRIVIFILLIGSFCANAETYPYELYQYDSSISNQALASLQHSIDELTALIRARPVYTSFFPETPAAMYANSARSSYVPSTIANDRTMRTVSVSAVKSSTAIR